MAVSWVGGAGASDASSATLTVTHGQTINENDIIVVACHANSTSANWAGDATYTFTRQYQETNPTADTSVYAIFYRVAGASEPVSYTFDTQTTADRVQLSLGVFSGGNTSTIWDITPSDSTRYYSGDGTHSAGITANSPSMTTTEADTFGIVISLRDSSASYTGVGNSYTNEVVAGTPQQSIYMWSRAWASAGATGDTTSTLSSSDEWVSHQFAVAPAASGVTIAVPLMNTPLW